MYFACIFFQFLNMLIQIKYLPIFHDISLKNVWVSMKFSNFEGRVIILLRKPNKIYLHILLTWKEIFLEISSHFPFMRKNLYFLCEHCNTSWLFELLCSFRILVLSWMCFIWIQLFVGLINCSLTSVSPKKCWELFSRNSQNSNCECNKNKLSCYTIGDDDSNSVEFGIFHWAEFSRKEIYPSLE